MLVKFAVSNFLSFNELTEFSMLAGSFKIHKGHLRNNSSLSVLKHAAIYGANGAGKSNFVIAIDALQKIVKGGSTNEVGGYGKFKLDPESKKKPTQFIIQVLLNSKLFEYWLVLGVNSHVIREELVQKHAVDNIVVFRRIIGANGRITFQLNDKYVKSPKDKLVQELYTDREFISDDELFLSKVRGKRYKEINALYSWIIRDLTIIYPHSKFVMLSPRIALDNEFRTFANSVLSTLQTGIIRLDLRSMTLEKYFGADDKDSINEILNVFQDKEITTVSDDEVVYLRENDRISVKKVVAIHLDKKGNEVEFEVDEESDGTQRLLDFIPALYSVIGQGKTFIIDEIDQSIHPYLLKQFVAKLLSIKNSNGQLIFTTHESNLLDLNILRQDEVWFTEKSDKGETTFYSLSEFQPRYDLDIRKGYLTGKFGAIPFMGDFMKLNWDSIVSK